MEKGEIEVDVEFEEAFLPSVSPEDNTEMPSPPEVPPPFINEVLEQVMKAAEQDLPKEREYELRHERKGEQTAPIPATAAVSVGQVLAQTNGLFPKTQAPISRNTFGTTRRQANTLSLDNKELYKRAMLLGFLSGIGAVLILIIIAVIR